jgi:hypothetical protein
LNGSWAYTAWGLPAGMTSTSPVRTICSLPSTINLPAPSRTCTIASPWESWELISSPWSKAKSVRLAWEFCARVLLTICPGRTDTRPARGSVCSCPMFLIYFVTAHSPSMTRPSTERVTTCQGINLPLFCRAVLAACSIPPQQGTSIRTTVTLLMLLRRIISVSLSL